MGNRDTVFYLKFFLPIAIVAAVSELGSFFPTDETNGSGVAL